MHLKRVLAYSTIGALGILMFLFGIGTPAAITAGVVYLLAHACHKGALFLVAGAIDHEVGTRDLAALGGLGRTMPVTASAAALAAVPMAGIPLTLGFIAKDQVYAIDSRWGALRSAASDRSAVLRREGHVTPYQLAL